ncbi:MAG: alkaline phosphatase family protein [Planctomycetota bacterium]|jgi:hypothetical protein
MSINILKIDILDFEDEDIGPNTVVSDPHPVVVLDDLSASDVTVSGMNMIVHLQGSVYDPIADIVEPGDDGTSPAQITEVFFDEQSVPVEKVADDRPEDQARRPYPFRGQFEFDAVMPITNGANTFVVEARNLIGNKGYDSVTVKAQVEVIFPPDTEGSAVCYPYQDPLTIQIPSDFTATVKETISIYRGWEDEVPDDSSIPETDVDSLSFSGSVSTMGPVTVEIASFTGIREGELDALEATVSVAGAALSESPYGFIETGPDTQLFRIDSVILSVEYDPGNDGSIVAYAGSANNDPPNSILAKTASSPSTYEGTTTDLGDAKIVVEPLMEFADDRVDYIRVSLTTSTYGDSDRALILEETGDTSLEFRSIGLGFSVGGVPSSGGMGARVVPGSIDVLNHQGTDEGVNNALVVRISDVTLADDPDRTASFWSSSFDLVDDADSQKRLDRPIMLVQKPVPVSIKNVKCIKDSTSQADLRISCGAGQRDFGVVTTSWSPDDAPKYAKGTQARLVLVGRGQFGLDAKKKVYFTFYDKDGNPSPIMVTKYSTLTANAGWERWLLVDLDILPGTELGRKDMSVWQFKEGEAGEKTVVSWTPDAIEIVNLKVIFVGIDGLHADVFRQAVESGQAKNFQRVLGEEMEYGRQPYMGDALNSLPTITFCNWATVFTGSEPKTHGITGNSFFAREKAGERPFNSANLNQVDEAQLGCATVLGLDCGLPPVPGYQYQSQLKAGVQTLFEKLPADMSKAVIGHYFSKGVSWFNTYKYPIDELLDDSLDILGTLGDKKRYVSEKYKRINILLEHSPTAACQLDRVSADYAVGVLSRWVRTVPDFMAVYFPGPDNVGHGVGYGSAGFPAGGQDTSKALDVTRMHFSMITDHHFGRIVDRIEEMGLAAATLYVIVSDHGMVGVDTGDDKKDLVLKTERILQSREDKYTDELKRLSDKVSALTDRVYFGGDVHEAEKYRVVYAPEGGLAHIYLRSQGKDWGAFPSFSEVVKPLAKELYDECIKDAGGADTLRTFEGAIGDTSRDEQPAILVRDPTSSEYVVFEWTGDYDPLPLTSLAGSRTNWEDIQEWVAENLDDGPAGSRAGDIILLFNIREGYNGCNKGDEFPGWHGGPTFAESRVPFWVAFRGLEVEGATFIDDALGEVIDEARPRLSHVDPLIRRIFEKVGR